MPYKGLRFPAEVIAQAVWLYHRFPLSFREVEELLMARGITVSHEAVRQWRDWFGPQCAAALRRRRPATRGISMRCSSKSRPTSAAPTGRLTGN
ncbi:IS6 family transposase [Streptomyces sp. 110]|uniref:IS6 family transposase n=1 Tax=Streptomyces endocoffeicus TaxID=2898945 RepID=A0ABS1Q4T7_9ACTN|nr:IS6 family transposase [Streptomyces endocoffeicus]